VLFRLTRYTDPLHSSLTIGNKLNVSNTRFPSLGLGFVPVPFKTRSKEMVGVAVGGDPPEIQDAQ